MLQQTATESPQTHILTVNNGDHLGLHLEENSIINNLGAERVADSKDIAMGTAQRKERVKLTSPSRRY